MPFMYASSMFVLESRLTAARAAALDELLPGAIPNDLNWLMTNPQFTPYSYGPSALADGAQFIPPAGTIVLSAEIHFFGIGVSDFYYFMATPADSTHDQWANATVQVQKGMAAVFYCDGNGGFEQNTTAARDLMLLGVTMA